MTTVSMSSVFIPLVVRAGVPNLTPDGLRADLSPGTVFLLQDMPTSSRINSPFPPERPPGLFLRSRWMLLWKSSLHLK